MQLFAYRNTERGARHAVDMREQRERQRVLENQRALYEAQQRAKEEREKRIAEQRERLAAFAAEMRAQGIRFRHTYDLIERRACKVFKCSRAAIRGNRRSKDIVLARQFVMYWSSRLTERSLPQIGRLCGGRDHTTVLHGKRAYIAKRRKVGRYLREAR